MMTIQNNKITETVERKKLDDFPMNMNRGTVKNIQQQEVLDK
jgi:hypothetical protein